MLAFALLVSLVWGICVALFLQYNQLGRFMEERMTWFMTATGVGVDLLILLLLMDSQGRVLWWQMVAVIALSSIAVSVRGILEFSGYFGRLIGLVGGQRDEDVTA